ncbi:MBL fold metallo-hydrolase [Hutsoniella sourekii]
MQFKVQPLGQSAWRIIMPGVCSYYIQGREAGLLIDTGWGYGSLKELVDSLALTPYQVVLSHGHCDHGGGAGEFPSVYLPRKDQTLATYSCSKEVRLKLLERLLKDRTLEDQDLLNPAEQYRLYDEGLTFDLGGITVSAVEVAGHTQGIMCFMMPELETVLYGDAIMNPTQLSQPSATSIESHLINLRQLKDHLQSMDIHYAWINHHPYEVSPQTLEANIFWCQQILAGEDDQVSKDHWDFCLARNQAIDHGPLANLGNIAYNPNRIFKELDE